MTTTNSNNNDSSSSSTSVTEVWLFIWCFALIAFLVIPICASQERRQRWWRRLVKCQWFVDGEDNEGGRNSRVVPYGGERNNTEESNVTTKQPLSKDEEAVIRQIFLLEVLSKVTKQLSEGDMRKVDVSDPPSSQRFQLRRGSSRMIPIDNENPSDTPSELTPTSHSLPFTRTMSECVVSSPSSSRNLMPQNATEDPMRRLDDGAVDDGGTVETKEPTRVRDVPSCCSVCLGEYVIGDRITWSSNPACKHIFHEDCLLQWYVAVGKKELRRRRAADGAGNSTMDPVEQVTNFPLLCPCCRQEFVSRKGNAPTSPRGTSSSSSAAGSPASNDNASPQNGVTSPIVINNNNNDDGTLEPPTIGDDNNV